MCYVENMAAKKQPGLTTWVRFERQVEKLRSKGWLIYEVGGQAEDDRASHGHSSDDEEQRGRPKKRRVFVPSSPVGPGGHKGDDTEANAVAQEETHYQKK